MTVIDTRCRASGAEVTASSSVDVAVDALIAAAHGLPIVTMAEPPPH